MEKKTERHLNVLLAGQPRAIVLLRIACRVLLFEAYVILKCFNLPFNLVQIAPMRREVENCS